MSGEDNEVGSDEELKEDESSLESSSDSGELVGSTETLDFLKDTELELDSLGTIMLEGGTSSSGVIKRANISSALE